MLEKYRHGQIKYLENLQRELELRKAKVANISYRKELKERQDRENYTTEVHRIRGILSQADNRLPIGTRERLHHRVKQIKDLRYGAFDQDN